MNPSSLKLHPFDPFLDSLKIKFEYFGLELGTKCGIKGNKINVRSVLYKKGEYVGLTRVSFETFANRRIRAGHLNIDLPDLGRCKDENVLKLQKFELIPRVVTWRMARYPYASVVFKDSREEPNFNCSNGMTLKDWRKMIDSTEITHIQLLFTIDQPLAGCLAAYFKIDRGNELIYYNYFFDEDVLPRDIGCHHLQ